MSPVASRDMLFPRLGPFRYNRDMQGFYAWTCRGDCCIRRALFRFAITTSDVLTEGLGTPLAPDTLDHERQGVGGAIPGMGDRDVLAVLQRRGHQRPRAGVGAERCPDGRQDALQLLEGFLCSAL